MSIMESAPGARAVIDGKEVDYFCGCSYFGFHGRRDLIDAACKATLRYGLGSATSRAGYGDNPILLAVESNAASFFDTESALYYVSGYMGNAILLQGLSDDYDIVFVDACSHYSVLDGASISNKPVVTFAHRDADDLKARLARHLKPGQRPVVICDGVFAVSGQLSPIPDYVAVLDNYDPYMICVDDAHAAGVIGQKGRGSFEYHGLSGSQLHAAGTLSKAFGGSGGIIACETALRARLIRKARMCFASSAPPTPVAAATAKALEVLREHPELRARLWDNVAHAKNGLRALGFEIDPTPVPIICLSSKEVSLARLPDELFARGIVISRYYAGGNDYSSVPEGGAVRIAIFATHSPEQIDRLVEEIAALV